jgi:SAM-dependent methyltransferase
MRILRFFHTLLRVLRLVLTVGAIGTGLFVYSWVRERYGRGGPFPASQAGALLNPLRDWIQPARATLEAFRIDAGQTVLEIGPGPGYFTIEASRMVGPSGRIVCLDVQREMASILRGRLRERGVANAHPLAGDATRLPLAGGSVDAAFLVAVLGEVPDRPAALLELRRVLRPGGVLAFSETLRDPDYVFEDTLRDLCRMAGFELLDVQHEFIGYTAVFTRTSA